MITLERLHSVLIKAWAPRTDITMPENLFVNNEPAAGQCAITSLIVQDYFWRRNS